MTASTSVESPNDVQQAKDSMWSFRNKLWLLLIIPVVLLILLALVPDFFQNHDPQRQKLRGRLLHPWSTSTEGFHLLGTEIKWKENYMGVGVEFENPNAISKCGCGETFSI